MDWRYDLSKRKIVLLGFGAVGEQLLDMLKLEIPGAIDNIIVIDAMPCKKKTVEAAGAKFVASFLHEGNLNTVLLEQIDDETVVINLTIQVQTTDVISLCHSVGALYIDTSNETWPEGDEAPTTITSERLDRLTVLKHKLKSGPTALVCHGANPGMVTHFVKQALCDQATVQGVSHCDGSLGKWAKLAQELSVVSVHLSELDTQVCDGNTFENKFANTWSVVGFIEEANEPVQFVWGSEEPVTPKYSTVHSVLDSLPLLQFSQRARHTVVRSWIPSQGVFDAFPIPHPEVFSIAQMLRTQNELGGEVYQPTVLFAYRPSPHCLDSLAKVDEHRLIPHVLRQELTGGWDELGALLIFRNGQAYWYGSRLRLSTARASTPRGNATIQQVCAGVIGGLAWIMENPHAGLVQAEDVDHELVLNVAKPYLGSLKGLRCKWVEPSGQSAWPTAPLIRIGSIEENQYWVR